MKKLRPGSKDGATRVRAHRVRAKVERGDELGPDEAAFLDSLEPMDVVSSEVLGSAPLDASASHEREIHISERKAAAQGAHPHPDVYAAVATATGLRADTLLRITTTSLLQAVDMYKSMCSHLLERTTRIEDAHVAMLETVRENYLGRVEAEAQIAALANATSGGDAGELMELLKFAMAARANHVASGDKGKRRTTAGRTKRPLGAL
jgi:hypothetical protein